MPIKKISRRRFVSTSATISAAAVALGPGLHTAAALVPRDKLNLALIGVGGRGRANTKGVSDENIYGLCDINPDALGKAKEQFPKAKVVTDWRKIVTDPGVDGVVVSTADHHHALVSIAAMRAGKHVYCEKPLAHTVREARVMQDEYKQRRGNIATQMGTQIHASENYRRVVELVQAGAIGPVREAHVWCSRTIRPVETAVLPAEPIPDDFDWDAWIGPAASRDYNTGYWKGGNLNWNRRWEFGNGVLGDMGSHLIDLPFWALKLHRPTSVESQGPAVDEVACPAWQEVTWEHPARDGNEFLNVPTKVVWYHGPEGMKRRSEYLQPKLGQDTNINKWSIGVAFVGDNGLLVADYKKSLLSPSANFVDYEPPRKRIAASLGHHLEWIHASKTGEESLCNFDYSGALIEHNLLGNVAHRAGKKLDWDAESFAVTNTRDVDVYLTKECRDGWSI